MYTKHFNLIRRPFSRVPKADGCVMFPGIKSCFERASEGIQECAGPILVIGPSGCGKSTLLALLQEEFKSQLSTVTLNCATIDTRHEMIQCLLFEMGLPFQSENVGELRLKLIDHLKSPEQCPNGLLLLIDEAHNLPLEVLEELRMITNMVCGSQHQIRLVIAGGRPLEEKMAHPQLESFSQRIGVRCYLQPMSRTETMFFALAQLQMCGRDGREIFQPSALEKIFDITDGVPRLVTHLCDHALKMAAQQTQNQINSKMATNAWLDLQQLPAAPELEDFQASGPEEGIIEFGSLDDAGDHGSLVTGATDDPEPVHTIQFDNTIDASDNMTFEDPIQDPIDSPHEMSVELPIESSAEIPMDSPIETPSVTPIAESMEPIANTNLSSDPRTDEEILAEFSQPPTVMPFQTSEPSETELPVQSMDQPSSIEERQPAEEKLEQLMNQLQNIDQASQEQASAADQMPPTVSMSNAAESTDSAVPKIPSIELTPEEEASKLSSALDAAKELSQEEFARKQEERRTQNAQRRQESEPDAPKPMSISNFPEEEVPILDPTMTQPLPLRSEYMKAEIGEPENFVESAANQPSPFEQPVDQLPESGPTSEPHVAPPQSVENIPAISADSLFGDSFDEEQVVDIQSSILADQNRVSSAMTSQELSNLTPHPETAQSSNGNSDGVEAAMQPAIIEDTTATPRSIEQSNDPLDHQRGQPIPRQPEIDVTMTQPMPQLNIREADPTESRQSFGEMQTDSTSQSPALPIEAAAHSLEPSTDATDSPQDDSDMLIVEDMPAATPTETPEPETASATSQGQVIRMNYQDLFQQLRNQNPNSQT